MQDSDMKKLMDEINSLEKPIMQIKRQVDKNKDNISAIMSSPVNRRLPIPPGSTSDGEERGRLGKIIQAIYRVSRGDYDGKDILDDYGVQLAARAMQEDVDSEGGYLVPIEHEPEILRIPDRGVIEPKCRRVPMGSKTRRVPKEDTGVTTYWVDEEAPITASDPVLGLETLTAKKQAGYTIVSNELIEDTAPDVEEYLERLFMEAMMLEVDNQVLNGTGDPCSGVLTAKAGYSVVMASGSTSFSAITFTILSEAISKLNPTILAEAIFVMSPTVLHYTRTLKDDQNRPIWTPAEPGPGRIYGHDIVESSQAPSTSAADTAFIVFGNFRGFLVGDRRQLTVAVDPYGKFDTDQTRIRWTRRVALAPAIPNHFVRIMTAAS